MTGRWGDYNRQPVHTWPVQSRPVSSTWCHCDEPQPRPVTLFGCAMGGMQECATCHMPIEDSEASNPRGAVPSLSVLLALTNGQRLVFAIVAAVFVVVFVVWPVVRPRPRMRPSDVDASTTWRRLMRELRRQP